MKDDKALETQSGGHGASEKIVRRKLSDEVIERLQDMLRRGEFAPGDSMPSERELMERFGVGRPAIREALQSLANMGLISISHGERAKVSQLSAQTVLRQVDGVARMLLSSSPDSLEHLKAARRFFETGMVREAAQRATAADVDDLKAMLERQRGFLGNPQAFIKADTAFHRRIATISGNPIFVAVCEAMLDWVFQFHSELLIWTGNEQVTLAEHAEIIEHIAARDPEKAQAAMGAHLDRSGEVFRHHH